MYLPFHNLQPLEAQSPVGLVTFPKMHCPLVNMVQKPPGLTNTLGFSFHFCEAPSCAYEITFSPINIFQFAGPQKLNLRQKIFFLPLTSDPQKMFPHFHIYRISHLCEFSDIFTRHMDDSVICYSPLGKLSPKFGFES